MARIDTAPFVEEISNFLGSFETANPLAYVVERGSFSALYTHYHSLLLWGLASAAVDDKASDISTYFREAVSDIANAVLLTLLGFYKPSRIMLRSGVENAARVLAFQGGIDAKEIKSVYDLFDAVKKAHAGSISSPYVVALHTEYARLCLTAHSATTDFMALRVPFKELGRYDQAEFRSNLSQILKVLLTLNRLLFFIWSAKLSFLSHKQADFVRDLLPKSLKRSVAET